jgi:hypothetical protein
MGARRAVFLPKKSNKAENEVPHRNDDFFVPAAGSPLPKVDFLPSTIDASKY